MGVPPAKAVNQAGRVEERGTKMPWTKKQKGLFGADYARAKKGRKTRTGMTKTQLRKALKEPTRKSRKK